MSDTIDNIAKKFKTFAEMQNFCESQFKLILDLQEQVKQISEQKSHLEKLLDTNSYLLKNPSEMKTLLSESLDAETIALSQLKILNLTSSERELTLEEAKKVELFYKVLTSIQSKVKKPEDLTKDLENDTLLKLVINKTDE